MMAREQTAVDTFSEGFNCAQSVFSVFTGESGISRETALLISSYFGGGMRCGEVCGAVTGALMALGLHKGFDSVVNPADKAAANTMGLAFEAKFRAKNGSIICRELLGYDLSVPEDLKKINELGLFKSVCPLMVSDAVVIAEEMLAEIK